MEMWEGRGVIRLKRLLGTQMGQRPTSVMPKRESESRGSPPSLWATRDAWVSAGADGAGPAVVPP